MSTLKKLTVTILGQARPVTILAQPTRPVEQDLCKRRSTGGYERTTHGTKTINNQVPLNDFSEKCIKTQYAESKPLTNISQLMIFSLPKIYKT